ncbi:MAG: PorT family protein [Muribaculaceae bacterium]|nr:PorT family protein [Muribaculaceae bacterium]
MDDRWIDSIRDKMADYDFVPPDGLLESVQDEVRGRRIRRMRVWGAIAASVALLVGIFAILFSEKTDRYVPLIVNVPDGDRENKSSNRQVNKIFSSATELSSISNTKRTAGVVETVLAVNEPASIPDIPSEARQVDTQEYQERVKKTDPEPADSYLLSISDNGMDTDSNVRNGSGSHLSVGLSASANGLGGLLNDNDIEGNPVPTASSLPYTRMGGGLISDPHANNAPTPRFIERFDHKLPVRFSVDFSLPVSHHFSFGAGVCYSYLRSDIRYGYSDQTLYKAIQNLHFIGIPMNLRWSPWRSGKIGIYVSAGVMAEKCIGGELKEGSLSNPTYRYEGYDERPFQFSFNASAGLQYSPAHKCAIFIEPGVGMYLKNGSKLRTIYSERPLTFNINVGLRFGH